MTHLSPHELREATIRDYMQAARACGLQVDRAALERQAVADCELADAYNRARPVITGTKPRPDPVARKARIDAQLAEQGTRLVDAKETVRQTVDGWHTRPASEREALRNGRVAMICRGATRHPDRAVAYSTCEIPHLAYALFRVQADFAASFVWKPRPGDEPNEFYGMNLKDRGRLLVRKVEDICDLSTGRLGPWRFGK